MLKLSSNVNECKPLISGAFTFQITISKQYNTVALFEDLKALYKVGSHGLCSPRHIMPLNSILGLIVSPRHVI